MLWSRTERRLGGLARAGSEKRHHRLPRGRRFSVRWPEDDGRLAFIIELTRGQSWHDPAEIIDRRDCATNSLEAAAAEAWAWLVEHQKHTPERGATHYRVGDQQQEIIVGGPEEVA